MTVLELTKLLARCRPNDDVVLENYSRPGHGMAIGEVYKGVPRSDKGDTIIVLRTHVWESTTLALNRTASDVDAEHLFRTR